MKSCICCGANTFGSPLCRRCQRSYDRCIKNPKASETVYEIIRWTANRVRYMQKRSGFKRPHELPITVSITMHGGGGGGGNGKTPIGRGRGGTQNTAPLNTAEAIAAQRFQPDDRLTVAAFERASRASVKVSKTAMKAGWRKK